MSAKISHGLNQPEIVPWVKCFVCPCHGTLFLLSYLHRPFRGTLLALGGGGGLGCHSSPERLLVCGWGVLNPRPLAVGIPSLSKDPVTSPDQSVLSLGVSPLLSCPRGEKCVLFCRTTPRRPWLRVRHVTAADDSLSTEWVHLCRIVAVSLRQIGQWGTYRTCRHFRTLSTDTLIHTEV